VGYGGVAHTMVEALMKYTEGAPVDNVAVNGAAKFHRHRRDDSPMAVLKFRPVTVMTVPPSSVPWVDDSDTICGCR